MSRIFYQDTIGCEQRGTNRPLAESKELPEVLKDAFLQRLGDTTSLTPIQIEAIDAGICNRNSHFIVSSPTNSGKTLVALFRMFSDILKKGGRCVYVAPLKALAEEKRTELEDLCEWIKKAGGPPIKVEITTGDYQLTGDFLGSAPPGKGQIVICTPERLEIILRSKENLFWARAVSSFVMDEFHLLGDSKRGSKVETLITRILVSCPWSRIIALSATMGGLTDVARWLESSGTPVTLLENNWRYPKLSRQIVETVDRDGDLETMAKTILCENERTLLIFVPRKRDAENAAKLLQKTFPKNKNEISFLHAGLTLKQRADCLNHLLLGHFKIVVATTALKMGIDAPVTDVLVLDPYLWSKKGRRLLSYSDLLQMTGRAGRRDIPGRATVFADEEYGNTIANLFRMDEPESLKPQLGKFSNMKNEIPSPVLSILLTEIVMQKKTTIDHLNEYLRHTFYGTVNGELDCHRHVNELVRLKLAYKDPDYESTFKPSKLGRTVSLTGLSPESGALLAGFLRALIKLDEKYEKKNGRRFGYLKRLTDLDLIFICCASFECRDSWLKSPSKSTVADLQEYMESLPTDDKPIVNLWRDETSEEYPTHRLLTTFRIPFDKGKNGQAEKIFYRILRTSVLLFQHTKGAPLARLAIKFNASMGGLENNLKFSVLWILNCLSQICNGKRCYKFDFLMMRALKLIECIAVGSELGQLLTIKGVGRRTVDKLIDGGCSSINDMQDFAFEDLENMGIGSRQAVSILKWSNRQSR